MFVGIYVKNIYIYIYLCIFTRFLNPRIAWCYMGEDFMGKSRTLCQVCHKGVPMWSVSAKFTERYRYGMDLLLKHPEMRR